MYTRDLYDDFISDLASDAPDTGDGAFITRKRLSRGVEKCVVRIKNEEESQRLRREKGVYVTFDAPGCADTRTGRFVSSLLSTEVFNLSGLLQRGSTVLISGLGNADVLADSLGEKTVKKIIATRDGYALRDEKYRVCTLSAGVSGLTGIQAAEHVTAVCREIKPDLVIVIDSLATSSPTRVGTSFQLTCAGITPGSGVGRDKPRLDKNVLGVPTLAIGVPLVLSMKTVMTEFFSRFSAENSKSLDAYDFRNRLVKEGLSALVVSPKEISMLVENASSIIAKALNDGFS